MYKMCKRALLNSCYTANLAAIVTLFIASYDHSSDWILRVAELATAICTNTVFLLVARRPRHSNGDASVLNSCYTANLVAFVILFIASYDHSSYGILRVAELATAIGTNIVLLLVARRPTHSNGDASVASPKDTKG